MQLSTPNLLLFNGKVCPWDQGKVHVWSETAIRGTNVFEGLRAYWVPATKRWRIVALDKHLSRLRRSADLMRIPCESMLLEMKTWIGDLLTAFAAAGESSHGDIYLRPTIFIDRGSYGYRSDSIAVGNYIVAFPAERSSQPKRQRYCVSSWRRFDDEMVMARAKIGAGYLNFRLSRIEADIRGLDDAILLNSRGHVAETGGACLLLRRGDTLVTPALSEGILESITREHLMELARRELGMRVVERPVDRSELYIADEVLSCGTLLELASVLEIDGIPIGTTTEMSDKLFELYRKEITTGQSFEESWLVDFDPDKQQFVYPLV